MSCFIQILADLAPICSEELQIKVTLDSGAVRRVRAFSTKSYHLYEMNSKKEELFGKGPLDGVLSIVCRSNKIDFSPEEKFEALRKGSVLRPDFFFNFLVVDDDSLETQLELLSVLGYPYGEADKQRISECQTILWKVYGICKFRIWKVNPLLGALFPRPLSGSEAMDIAKMVVPFLEKFGDVMYSGISAHAKDIKEIGELQM